MVLEGNTKAALFKGNKKLSSINQSNVHTTAMEVQNMKKCKNFSNSVWEKFQVMSCLFRKDFLLLFEIWALILDI